MTDNNTITDPGLRFNAYDMKRPKYTKITENIIETINVFLYVLVYCIALILGNTNSDDTMREPIVFAEIDIAIADKNVTQKFINFILMPNMLAAF